MNVWTTLAAVVVTTLCFIVWWAVIHHMDDQGNMQDKSLRADINGYVGIAVISIVAIILGRMLS